MQLALEQMGVWSLLQVTVQAMFIIGVSGYLLRAFRSGG
jgi:hypothetical protein